MGRVFQRLSSMEWSIKMGKRGELNKHAEKGAASDGMTDSRRRRCLMTRSAANTAEDDDARRGGMEVRNACESGSQVIESQARERSKREAGE